MSKRNKLRKQVESQSAAKIQAVTPLTLGTHTFRVFEGVDAAFGARLSDYPPMSDVPDGLGKYQDVVSGLFFRGGTLASYGLQIKPSLNKQQVLTTIQALLSSWDPKHEHKTDVVAWALSEWCDGEPKRGDA